MALQTHRKVASRMKGILLMHLQVDFSTHSASHQSCIGHFNASAGRLFDSLRFTSKPHRTFWYNCRQTFRITPLHIKAASDILIQLQGDFTTHSSSHESCIGHFNATAGSLFDSLRFTSKLHRTFWCNCRQTFRLTPLHIKVASDILMQLQVHFSTHYASHQNCIGHFNANAGRLLESLRFKSKLHRKFFKGDTLATVGRWTDNHFHVNTTELHLRMRIHLVLFWRFVDRASQYNLSSWPT